MDQKQRRARLAQAIDIEDRKNVFGPGRPGGPLGSAPKRKGRPPGTSKAAIIRRLRRYHPELHQLVLAGEITLYSAAAAAGFRGTGVPRAAALDEATITPLQEMELWLGVSHQASTFASARDCRRLWEAHRKRLLDRWGNEGRRPQAWWKFDTSIPYPGYARERSTLYEHGLLGEAEARALVADWKVEFERASQPDFFFTAGPGEILHGEAARQKHFEWADIPQTLLQQFEAARAQTKRA
jgi:hypothetical protein